MSERIENSVAATTAIGSGVSALSAEHRDRAWRDRFDARWHYDWLGGWIRTGDDDEASTFGLRPIERYGPFTEDRGCPADGALSTRERHEVAAAIRQADTDMPLTEPFDELHDCIQAVYLQMADAAIAAHLRALSAAGYVVVKLPEPTYVSRFQESVWDVAESSVILDRWNQVSVHLDDWDDEGPSTAEALGLAAALLAVEHTRSSSQQRQVG
ncbi:MULTISPECIES: hypothetical protein [Mycolicibacterium]|uniref:hypothetical protein n=1 Tax=Mycolicibacterium TaxID=1866885 RepID=UPI001A990EE2|nr:MULTISPECIES: hypothetical protein [Mycolicibacterium]